MSAERKPHAVLDLPSRHKKALKIERLLALQSNQPLRLLEIGTGSGGIAHYFATHPHLDCDVTAVDVIDQRLINDGYQFVQVNDTTLPFDDSSFDVVITNHVIEHVGDRKAQLHHLQEVRRVMTSTGKGYVAVPNRWMLVEPHYRLAFLSWLPHFMRTPYLRLMQRGDEYDCEPLTLKELDRLLHDAGFIWRHAETAAIREMQKSGDIHGFINRCIVSLPDAVFVFIRPMMPTLICVIQHPAKAGALQRMNEDSE